MVAMLARDTGTIPMSNTFVENVAFVGIGDKHLELAILKTLTNRCVNAQTWA